MNDGEDIQTKFIRDSNIKYNRQNQSSQKKKNTQTLAASATISGSSIAVTSFKAGSEFATRTTWKNTHFYCSNGINLKGSAKVAVLQPN